jgi:hypothetical protein
MDEKFVYLYDISLRKVCIYSQQNFTKIAEFGKLGQGPQEFIAIEKVSLSPDYLMISSFPKICLYNRNGKFIKEIKSKDMNAGGFILFGDHFIGESFYSPTKDNPKNKIVLGLYDKNLKKEKEITSVEFKTIVSYGGVKSKILRFSGFTQAVVSKEKLFVGSTERGFYIAVFDDDGDKLYEIVRQYNKRKVTNEDRDFDLNYSKKSYGEVRWKNFSSENEYTYPDYYPAFMNFEVTNGKIYVFPYPVKNQAEVIILDLKGNLIKQKALKMVDPWILESRWFTIYNGKVYYVYDNQDTDQWELHGEPVD